MLILVALYIFISSIKIYLHIFSYFIENNTFHIEKHRRIDLQGLFSSHPFNSVIRYLHVNWKLNFFLLENLHPKYLIRNCSSE